MNSKKEEAIQNQYEFFVQRMGGPPLYSQRKGMFFQVYKIFGFCGFNFFMINCCFFLFEEFLLVMYGFKRVNFW